MKKRLLIMSELDEKILERLAKEFYVINKGKELGESFFLSESQIIEEISFSEPEIIIVGAQGITNRVLDSSSNLKMIVVTRGNPVNVDLEACRKRSIIVTCTPGRNANSVAELVIALMICLSRNVFQAYEAVKTGTVTIDKRERALNKGDDVIWTDPNLKEIPYSKFRGFDIEGKAVGLIGFGAVGRKTATKAIALGMEILVFDPYVSNEEIQNAKALPVPMDDLLAKSDFVSLHSKVTKDTKNMIGEKELLKMKESAYLINTARGALVDHQALLKVLREKKIAGAAVDVFYYEPIARDDPFLELDNFIITPHIGGASSDVITRHSEMAWESIIAYTRSTEIPYRVV